MEMCIRDRIVASDFLAALEGGFFSKPQEKRGTTYYQFCTAIPVGTLLAQSWDVELIKRVGEMIGHEMELFNVTLWLAPGMNIHRNPLDVYKRQHLDRLKNSTEKELS